MLAFHNLSAYYCISTLVTLISAITEIIIWRSMMKITWKDVISHIIKRRDKKIIERAVRMLVKSDLHDSYFVQCCQEELKSTSDHLILGTNLHVVVATAPVERVKYEVVQKENGYDI